MYHFFGLDPSLPLDQLEAKGRRYCDTDWTAIAARRGAEVHVDRYCFRCVLLPTSLCEALLGNSDCLGA